MGSLASVEATRACKIDWNCFNLASTNLMLCIPTPICGAIPINKFISVWTKGLFVPILSTANTPIDSFSKIIGQQIKDLTPTLLAKSKLLDDKEYEHIKTHALKTKNILQQVNFEGVYKEVPEIAAAHHEKLDGTGYPEGLTDEEIPFGAKIIAVADVFEALTSRRHYREPMPVNEAFDYIMRYIGIHFDQKCAMGLIDYYNNSSTVPYIHKGQFKSLDTEEESFYPDKIRAVYV